MKIFFNTFFFILLIISAKADINNKVITFENKIFEPLKSKPTKLYHIEKISITTLNSTPTLSLINENLLIDKIVTIKYEKDIFYPLICIILTIIISITILFVYWNRKITLSNTLLQEAHKTIDKKNKELDRLATIDKLTAIYNRNRLDNILATESKRANRSACTFGVIIIDIDFFKSVNDTYGHQMGDITLKEFAKILKSNSRKTDFIGRWGGEEFMIICTETNKHGILSLAKNLKEKIEHYSFSINEKKTASFGVTLYQKSEAVNSVIKRADDGLYKGKKNGRNRVEYL